MVSAETSTLEIVAKMRDLASPSINRLQGQFAKLGTDIGLRSSDIKRSISGVTGALSTLAAIGTGLVVGSLVAMAHEMLTTAEEVENLDASVLKFHNTLSANNLTSYNVSVASTRAELDKLTKSTKFLWFTIEDAPVKDLQSIQTAYQNLFAAIEAARLDPNSQQAIAFDRLKGLGTSQNINPQFQSADGQMRKGMDVLKDIVDIGSQSKEGGIFAEVLIGDAGLELMAKAQRSMQDIKDQLEALSKIESPFTKWFQFPSEIEKSEKDRARKELEAAKAAEREKVEAAKKGIDEKKKLEEAHSKDIADRFNKLQDVLHDANMDNLTDVAAINAKYEEQIALVTKLALLSGEDAQTRQAASGLAQQATDALTKKKDADIKALPNTANQPFTNDPDKDFSAIDAMKGKLDSLKNQQVKSLNEALLDTSMIVGDQLVSAFANLGKEGVDAGEQIRSVLSGLASDLARYAMQQLVLKSVTGIFGGVAAKDGAVFPGHFQPVKAFAEGGIVNRPTIGLIGEGGGPEAVVPLKGGKIPVQNLGGGGGSNFVVNISATDSKSFEDMLARPGSRRRMRDAMREAMSADVPMRRQINEI